MEAERLYFKVLSDFLSNHQANKLEEMRKLEGSNYGLHFIGLYDPAFLFIHRFLVRLHKENSSKHEAFVRLIKDNKIQTKISQIVCNLSSKTDLSPRGLISLLMLLYDLLNITIWD